MRYLCDNLGGDRGEYIFPRDPKKRAEINMYLGQLNDIREAAFNVVYAKFYLARAGKKAPQTLLDLNNAAVDKGLKEIDTHLADKRYIVFE